MLGVGRDLCWSSSPNPLPKQAAQDLMQAGFEYLQRRRSHNLSGQPVPVLHHPQSKEVFPHVQMELLILQFVPVATRPVAGHHWKEFGPILLTPTLQVFVSIYKVPSQGKWWISSFGKAEFWNCFGLDTQNQGTWCSQLLLEVLFALISILCFNNDFP